LNKRLMTNRAFVTPATWLDQSCVSCPRFITAVTDSNNMQRMMTMICLGHASGIILGMLGYRAISSPCQV
jgi:hypothetical protein